MLRGLINTIDKLLSIIAWGVAIAFIASCVHEGLISPEVKSSCDTTFITDTVYVFVHPGDSVPDLKPPHLP